MSKKTLNKCTTPPPASTPDVPLLGPEWVASFSVYWRTLGPKQQGQLIELVEAAAQETTTERAICLIQQALRKLGIIEVQIIKLILTRFLDHARLNTPQPAQQIAAEVLATLRSIATKRRAR